MRRAGARRRLLASILSVVAILCLLPSPRARAAAGVRVGSKRFTESFILGEVVVRLCRDAGLEATHAQGLGATAVTFRALEDGAIDAYPEYTGTLAEILGVGGDAIGPALQRRGLGISEPLGFENTYALATKRSLAKRLGLRTISDLARHGELRFGLSHELVGRSDGWPRLSKRYALAPTNLVALDHGVAYDALGSGKVDVIDVYTTDAKIPREDLAVLADDLGFFPRYDAVIVYREDLIARAPAFTRVLARVRGSIDASTMRRLNARAEIDGVPFAKVADELFEPASASSGASARRPFLEALAASIAQHGPRHLWLVAIALLASTFVGVPLGVVATERRRVGAAVLAVAGVVQTIPSLALFCFFIPLLGIGAVPALAALFLYGLLPIVRSTHAGLASVPAELREAALALGLSTRERLRHVEIPLASRAILAGVETSAVVCVGSATIAAFIGAGGFGEPISTGLSLNDIPTILVGAIPAAALALAVQGLFAGLGRALVPRGLRR